MAVLIYVKNSAAGHMFFRSPASIAVLASGCLVALQMKISSRPNQRKVKDAPVRCLRNPQYHASLIVLALQSNKESIT
jgi:hypothetical protein